MLLLEVPFSYPLRVLAAICDIVAVDIAVKKRLWKLEATLEEHMVLDALNCPNDPFRSGGVTATSFGFLPRVNVGRSHALALNSTALVLNIFAIELSRVI